MSNSLTPHIGTIVGGVIGLTSGVGTLAVSRWWDRRGKLRIFCKRTNDRDLYWGFHQSETGSVSFLVPFDFELMNTSNTARVIRDVQMRIYREGNELFRMKQIEGVTNTKRTNGKVVKETERAFGVMNSSYSFVVSPISVQKVKCEYISPSNPESRKGMFDEIKIAYYDERNRLHNKHLAYYTGDWVVRRENPDADWIELK